MKSDPSIEGDRYKKAGMRTHRPYYLSNGRSSFQLKQSLAFGNSDWKWNRVPTENQSTAAGVPQLS